MERSIFGLREVKLASEGADMTFSGYGAVFGNIDSYGDVIEPGAFGATLAEAKASGDWPAMLLQHGGLTAEDNTPIGIWTDLAEDGIGLKVTGKLADTPRGREIYTLLKMEPRPAIKGMSIGYRAAAYEQRTKPEDPRRRLTKLDLFEVSIVTFPANRKANITDVKSGLTERDAERALRDAGFSRSEAKAVIASGFKALPQRDAGEAGTKAALERLLTTLKS
ncbi:HK97 family phage prohead protease [Rhodovarius crocodyli]|uniref:HK97 family phage prohead protease n=1 Tax=Rhodovarius crocodyli TaxID=1979269 RepID=A0A437MN70_9PROT|nr:HK97 family phage prohead protease [Rhodovarius crocodyli]RVT99091.1 HK97 family phage prohead protease [Rhodovarius crocodyli]